MLPQEIHNVPRTASAVKLSQRNVPRRPFLRFWGMVATRRAAACPCGGRSTGRGCFLSTVEDWRCARVDRTQDQLRICASG